MFAFRFRKKYSMQDTLGWTGTLVLKFEGNIQIKTKICRKVRNATCLKPTGRWTSSMHEKQLLSAILLEFFLTENCSEVHRSDCSSVKINCCGYITCGHLGFWKPWPVSSPIFSVNRSQNRKIPANLNYHMSIKESQAIKRQSYILSTFRLTFLNHMIVWFSFIILIVCGIYGEDKTASHLLF